MVKRRRMTAARRRQIHLAQMMSARKRGRSKDTVGHWVAKSVRKVASMATMGASSTIVEFMDGVKISNRRKQEAKLKRHRRKKRR